MWKVDELPIKQLQTFLNKLPQNSIQQITVIQKHTGAIVAIVISKQEELHDDHAAGDSHSNNQLVVERT